MIVLHLAPAILAGLLLVAGALGATTVAVWVRLRQAIRIAQRRAVAAPQLERPEPETDATGRLYAITARPAAPLETRHHTNPNQPIVDQDDPLWRGWSL